MPDAFLAPMREQFPGAEPFEQILDNAYNVLGEYGFTKGACIPNLSMCRDELCTHAIAMVQQRFGEPFGMRGLAGVLSCGQTGFAASNAHSPVCPANRRRYVYIHAVHIGMMPDGTFGKCERYGINHATTACGALVALHSEISGGTLSTDVNLADVEMSTLRNLVAPHIANMDHVPDIVELTKLVSQVVVEEQLKKFIEATVDTSSADYALIAGVQIHAPNGVTYFAPVMGNCYAVVNGERVAVDVQRRVNSPVGSPTQPARAKSGSVSSSKPKLKLVNSLRNLVSVRAGGK